MFLTENASQEVLNNLHLRMDIGKELVRSEDYIRRLAKLNERNNDLTKYSVLLIIKKETQMDFADILVPEKPVAAT